MAVVITVFEGYSDLYSQKNDTITVDATVRESHEHVAEVTEHPVESGTEISDNIRMKPRKLTIEGVVSATPVMDPGNSPTPNRHVVAYNSLTSAMEERRLISVATGLKKYQNLAIESFTVTREPKDGASLAFTLTCKEVTTVVSRTSTIPKSALAPGPTRARASGQAVRGLKQATPATPAHKTATAKPAAYAVPKPAPRYQSLLLRGLHFFKWLIVG